MAFKLNLSKTYFTPVVVEVPVDGGGFEKMTFDAEFKRVNSEELERLLRIQREEGKSDRDILNEILVGWKGIKTPADEDLPFSETNRELVYEVVQAKPALIQAFFNSIAKVRQKN